MQNFTPDEKRAVADLREHRPAFFQLVAIAAMCDPLPLKHAPRIARHDRSSEELRNLAGDSEAIEAAAKEAEGVMLAERSGDELRIFERFAEMIVDNLSEDEREQLGRIAADIHAE